VTGKDMGASVPDQERQRCDTCGRFLDFADICFSAFHYTPLNEFGPEETSWTGPCCRWRGESVK
jgi:hypothetical protein